MTTQRLHYFNNQELPAWVCDDLKDDTGTQYDMSSGWTFTVTLARTTAPATALAIKSTGITASATAITVAWSASDWSGLEAAVNGTPYVVLLQAVRTSDSYSIAYRPNNPPTLQLKAAPGTSAVSPNSYPITVTAASVTVADAGGYYTGDDVEEVLAEIANDDRLRVPCASRALQTPQNTTLSDGIVTAGTFRTQHTMLCSASDLRLTYSNSYNLGGVDTAGLNEIRVRASIETSSGVTVPVYFNGARDVVIQAGTVATCDPVGVTMAKGTSFWCRQYVQVFSGDKWPLNLLNVAANGEGDNRAAGAADVTLGAAPSTNGLRGFGPARIDGTPRYGSQTTVAIVGDSVMAGTGTGDQDVGFMVRALNGNYNYQSVARASEGATSWGSPATYYRRFALLQGCTVAVTNHGINSISGTLATIQSLAIGVWNALVAKGTPVYQTTITPWTTSSDSWATTGNQTVTANETKRTQFNDWLRAGAPMSAGEAVAIGTPGALVAGDTGHPLTDVFEVADTVETARNSGFWRSVGSGEASAFTADGIHPTAAGAIAAATAITTSTFGAQTA